MIGLSILQLLKSKPIIKIWSQVRSTAQTYFHSRRQEYDLPAYQQLLPRGLEAASTLVIDLAGRVENLVPLIQQRLPVWSLILSQTVGIQFISGPIWPADYRHLLYLMQTGQIHLPIARQFPLNDFLAAFKYQQQAPHRGRHLLPFPRV
ncbi:hypothetical protein HU830_07215 [Lactobacillus sp. DCY120]|uniref:Uncharacterized protein n=1 Tax=Bombilactobacillus apium TaxID=2675299 RepID=A0A850RDX6_9LACO|nr:hypothetical protein [Bombilactobacillus apium]NVY96938.1 hypothetical protein [Bombilactobacillus apium]